MKRTVIDCDICGARDVQNKSIGITLETGRNDLGEKMLVYQDVCLICLSVKFDALTGAGRTFERDNEIYEILHYRP
jgi:hypothetical protein